MYSERVENLSEDTNTNNFFKMKILSKTSTFLSLALFFAPAADALSLNLKVGGGGLDAAQIRDQQKQRKL